MVSWFCLSDVQFKFAQYTCKESLPLNFQPCKFSMEFQSKVELFLAQESYYSYLFCAPNSAISYSCTSLLSSFSETARE